MIPATRKRIFLLICAIVIICLLIRLMLYNGPQEEDLQHVAGKPVIVTVFYEALCPDSKHFIIKQLVPAYEVAAPLIDIEFVPYGKATTFENGDGLYRFECQHGPMECLANTYHACTIEAIEDTRVRLNMIACMIKDNRQPKEAMLRCAKELNIESIDIIQKCMDSAHVSQLLKLKGDLTHALRPAVSFIPTITLDGSQGRQAGILKNLLAEVCKIVRGTEQATEICKNV